MPSRLLTSRTALLCTAAVVAAAVPMPACTQQVELGSLVSIGSQREDQMRVDQLLGRQSTAGFLMRTTSSLSLTGTPALPKGQWRVTLLAPELTSVWNSTLPFSMNDGSLWAGRGWNLAARLGAMVQFGRVTLIVAPEFNHEQNLPFQVIPYGGPSRSAWANFLHPPPQSIDNPLRFGDKPINQVLPGQSSLHVRLGPMDVGAATENMWWGPAIWNAIVMSNQAPGFPHLFASTARPLHTGIGDIEGTWILGRLTESKYFDGNAGNDHRTLSGLLLTLTPSFDRGLTFGVDRVVFATLPRGRNPLLAAFDFARNVGRPHLNPPTPIPAVARDQIFELFARWVFPGAGFEAYGEWARFEQPGSLRDFLEYPERSQGYTVGLQWAHAHASGSVLRIQAEETNLEPDGSWRFKPPFSNYASNVVPQGYTNRGQILGAAIGTAASGQWLAVDHLDHRGWSLGGFIGRARLEAEARFTSVVPWPRRGDVLVFWGLRGHVDVMGWTVTSRLTEGLRLNYLFQTYEPNPTTGKASGVDLGNTTLSIGLTKAGRR